MRCWRLTEESDRRNGPASRFFNPSQAFYKILSVLVLQGRQTAAAHFTVEAGNGYYLEVKNTWHRDHGAGEIGLRPLDSDEGQLLANKFSFSIFQPKK
jgi:hypothetical protein